MILKPKIAESLMGRASSRASNLLDLSLKHGWDVVRTILTVSLCHSMMIVFTSLLPHCRESLKAGASAAADTASKTASVTKLQGEIMYLKNRVRPQLPTLFIYLFWNVDDAAACSSQTFLIQIDTQKREFGVAIFDHMRVGSQVITWNFSCSTGHFTLICCNHAELVSVFVSRL